MMSKDYYSVMPEDICERKIILMYESGMTLMDISAETYMSSDTVRRHLLHAGVKMRPPSRRSISESTIKRICELYESGEKYKIIAEKCGVSFPTIEKYVLKHFRRRQRRRQHDK